MDKMSINFGIIDHRFLSRSIGILNPRPPLCLSENASLEEVLRLLKSNKIGAVILTDQLGKVSGVFTERDVVLKFSLEDIPLNTPVSTLMTKAPKTLEMTSAVAYALQMMSEQGYRHLPIVDEENYPVGMISVKDLVDFIVRSLSKALLEFDDL